MIYVLFVAVMALVGVISYYTITRCVPTDWEAQQRWEERERRRRENWRSH